MNGIKVNLTVVLSMVVSACSEGTMPSNCQVAIEASDGSVQFERAPDIDLSKGLDFTIPKELENASSILCERTDLTLTETDFLTVSAENKPVMFRDGETLVVLEMSNGQFRLRTLEGKLSEEQIDAAQKAMNEAQNIIQED